MKNKFMLWQSIAMILTVISSFTFYQKKGVEELIALFILMPVIPLVALFFLKKLVFETKEPSFLFSAYGSVFTLVFMFIAVTFPKINVVFFTAGLLSILCAALVAWHASKEEDFSFWTVFLFIIIKTILLAVYFMVMLSGEKFYLLGIALSCMTIILSLLVVFVDLYLQSPYGDNDSGFSKGFFLRFFKK